MLSVTFLVLVLCLTRLMAVVSLPATERHANTTVTTIKKWMGTLLLRPPNQTSDRHIRAAHAHPSFDTALSAEMTSDRLSAQLPTKSSETAALDEAVMGRSAGPQPTPIPHQTPEVSIADADTFNLAQPASPADAAPILEAYRPTVFQGASREEQARENRELMTRLARILEENYSDPEFRSRDISDHMGMSPRSLQRKLSMAGQKSPKDFLQEIRLAKAAEALAAGGKPSQVAFEVGFSSHSYFSRCFKARYGVSPSTFGKGVTPARYAC